MNPHVFLSNTEFPAYREQGNSAFSFSRFGINILIESVCTFTILVFGTMQKKCRPDFLSLSNVHNKQRNRTQP